MEKVWRIVYCTCTPNLLKSLVLLTVQEGM